MAFSYRCDRCGNEGKDPLNPVSVESIDAAAFSSIRPSATKSVCNKCADVLYKQFSRFAKGE